MTKPIAEQVAELKVGDWVEARFEFSDRSTCIANGELVGSFDSQVFVNGHAITNYRYTPSPYLTSVTRVPRPIPSEPEVGSFGLCDDGVTTQRRTRDFDTDLLWQRNNLYCSWSEIYPHIVKLYTPSGDLVTGFEYATSKDAPKDVFSCFEKGLHECPASGNKIVQHFDVTNL